MMVFSRIAGHALGRWKIGIDIEHAQAAASAGFGSAESAAADRGLCRRARRPRQCSTGDMLPRWTESTLMFARLSRAVTVRRSSHAAPLVPLPGERRAEKVGIHIDRDAGIATRREDREVSRLLQALKALWLDAHSLALCPADAPHAPHGLPVNPFAGVSSASSSTLTRQEMAGLSSGKVSSKLVDVAFGVDDNGGDAVHCRFFQQNRYTGRSFRCPSCPGRPRASSGETPDSGVAAQLPVIGSASFPGRSWLVPPSRSSCHPSSACCTCHYVLLRLYSGRLTCPTAIPVGLSAHYD